MAALGRTRAFPAGARLGGVREGKTLITWARHGPSGAHMAPRSGHIKFKKGIRWKDLARTFPGMFKLFLEESGQKNDDELFDSMLLKQNMACLEMNQKPEGYNRNNRVRMVFPLTDRGMEFYIYRTSGSDDIVRITNRVSEYLTRHRVPHKVEWDKMLLYELKGRGKRPS
jgi:hypothetical protein